MLIEHADLSLVGDREDNQDRVAVAVSDRCALLVVIDGMGGHADGRMAADMALESILQSFWQTAHPIFDPQGFMHLTLSKAHDDVVRIGDGRAVDVRPRATTAICLVQDGGAFWAHIGDSRVYHLRHGRVKERTRDHSHVEMLLREGRITEAQVATHPMRNFVECCLGGDPAIPEMSLTPRRALEAGDLVLVCTDGIWSNLSDSEIASFHQEGMSLRESLEQLGERALRAGAPFADNSSAAALRWLGD